MKHADILVYAFAISSTLAIVVWYVLAMFSDTSPLKPCRRVDIVASPRNNPQRLCPHPDHLAHVSIRWVPGGFGEAVLIACVCGVE